MTARKNDRKLEGRWAYARRRLLRLPQEPFGIEVDFCPLPDIVGGQCGYWLGLVIDHHDSSMLLSSILDQLPDVNELAYLVTGAMEGPGHRGPCRPEVVFLRDNPEWDEMYSFLEKLEVEARTSEDLRHWDARAEELTDWLVSHWATWPKTPVEYEKILAVSKNLFDLRNLAHWFIFLVEHKSR